MSDRGGLGTLAWAVAAVVAVLLGMRLLGSDGAAPPAVRVGGQTAMSAGRGSRDERRPTGPYVHVAGAVRRPGLYRLGEGARVAAAVERAGGAARGADLTAINLAARLQDGQQVVVPTAVTDVATAGVGDAAAGPPRTPVSIGTATVEQLDGLDGIGPTLAQRIVDYRQEHGGLRSLDQLGEVEGIGEKRLESLLEVLSP